MATAKLRVGGTWVDTTLTGSVRVGGASVPYGPGGAPAMEALAWAQPPAFTDLVDGGETYNMGCRFSLVAAKPCHGVEWRVPDTVSTPAGGEHVASLWSVTTGLRVRHVAFTPTPGVVQRITFVKPPADPDAGDPWPSDPLSTGEFWVAAVYTRHYVFRTGVELFPAVSPSGNIVADEGRLISWAGGSNIYPAPSYNAGYYLSPLMGV